MSAAQLELAASVLGPLTDEVVFLGGATVGLWRSDPAARAPRVTLDVDVAAEVFSLAGYERFQERLRAQGLEEDRESGVLCRWRDAQSDLVLDVVPIESRLAGIDDRWLADAVVQPRTVDLPSGTSIRAVGPAWLLVLKLQAFADRGEDDALASRDFEDLILLVDGRRELHDEVAALPDHAREFIQREIERVQALPSFDYGVEGALATPVARARAQEVTVPRLQRLGS